MSKAIKAVRYLLTNNATIGGLIGSRCYPVDGVPKTATMPYIAMTRLSDRSEPTLSGETVDERFASIQLEIVSRTYADAVTIGAACPAAINGGARTVNGVAVTESLADDGGDQPDGPIDLDVGQAFVQTVDVQIAYVP